MSTDLETRLDRALVAGDRANTRQGAGFARYASTQDVETPPDFMAAVVRRWGPIGFDLAATKENAKARAFFSPGDDALAQSWAPFTRTNMWLNPPYSDIAPWAKKCAEAPLGPLSKILLLVPASVGSNWFAHHVHGRALVLALQGRLTFVGHSQPYPKDLVLAVYGEGLRGFDVWNWRKP